MTAFASILIAAFTATLWVTNGRQLRLARDEFNATHRPRIVVRDARLANPGDKEDSGLVDFDVANAGETPARIVSFIAMGYIQTDDAAFIPKLFSAGTRVHPGSLVVTPGQHVLVQAKCREINWEYETWKASSGAHQFVLGAVEYIGNDNIVRTMGFCREYSRTTGRWHAIDDPAYEYN
jgi:hypothetical protein